MNMQWFIAQCPDSWSSIAQQRDFEKARRMQYSPAIILKSSFHLQTTPVGFEPTRGDPIGLAGRRLSRSAKVSLQTTVAAAAVQRYGLLKQVPSYTKFAFHRGSELIRLGLVAVGHQGNVFERH